MYDINGWTVLLIIFIGIIAYKAFEVICFTICTIIACFTNHKTGALDVILNSGKKGSKATILKETMEELKNDSETKKASRGRKKGE